MGLRCWIFGHDLIRVVKTEKKKPKLFHECEKCDFSSEILPNQRLKVKKIKPEGRKISFPQKKAG